MKKLNELFFTNVADKVRKVVKVVFWVCFWITTVCFVIGFIVGLVAGISNIRYSILVFLGALIGIPLCYVFFVFILWLSQTTLLMFCDLVDNSSILAGTKKVIDEPTVQQSEENNTDTLKF